MSETILKILASELQTIRIVCKNKKCEAVTEVLVENLDRTFRHGKCPACQEYLIPPAPSQALPDFLGQLQLALAGLCNFPDRFAVEFVLPAKDEIK